MNDGRADFDFLHGDWAVANRRLARRLEDCDEWLEFESRAIVRPILHGLGNADRFVIDDLPGVGPFEGFTLRLFDPAARTWAIHWASTGSPGRLDPPLTGSFDSAGGVFHGSDVHDGRPIRVRFEWDRGDGTRARWAQSFSPDDGATWERNWVMELTRAGAPHADALPA